MNFGTGLVIGLIVGVISGFLGLLTVCLCCINEEEKEYNTEENG